MKITDRDIDNGKPFDWGKTSLDYAKFRDIYPKEFYQKIVDRKLCIDGQSILDVGTGTGVLPRNMYQYGAKWRATDISGNQIEQAKILSKDMDIDYYVVPTEDISFSVSPNQKVFRYLYLYQLSSYYASINFFCPTNWNFIVFNPYLYHDSYG